MMPKVRQRFELPIVETVETAEGVEYTVRTPDLFGAVARWGQVADHGATMTVIAEIDETERRKIPALYRRETLD